jgi:hypothetical protein
MKVEPFALVVWSPGESYGALLCNTVGMSQLLHETLELSHAPAWVIVGTPCASCGYARVRRESIFESFKHAAEWVAMNDDALTSLRTGLFLKEEGHGEYNSGRAVIVMWLLHKLVEMKDCVDEFMFYQPLPSDACAHEIPPEGR